ncbi:MAG: glutamate--tRNA ligase [Deltaproteobacteria bacterium]|nr:MAG: glutamate--tRNA ligase [Deltaproteobacteria bacterium]
MGPRVRFAPSPTGYLHIGGARTALFNWLWARRHGGVFVLRIEDTDRERSSIESVRAILDGLRWLGLDWDEGPEVGGAYGPYFQMERLEIYRAHAERLIREGKAYRCYCTKEELDALREAAQARGEQFRYPGTCREREDRPDLPHVVRIKMPTEGATTFEDVVRGTITTPHETLQDEVILRGDGVPLYNFGAVVDDATMEITLVARGDDHINNTARQILIFQALGYEPPRYAHLPMILGPDKKRLSKRHGAVSVTWYREQGYLPHAMVNYLARLGWSWDDKTEIFSREELLERFDFDRVGKSPAIFDAEKLAWINQHWMKESSDAVLAGYLVDFLKARGIEAEPDEKLLKIVAAYKPRVKTLAEMADRARVFYSRGVPEFDEKAKKKFLVPANREVLVAVREQLAAMEAVDEEALEAWMRSYAAERGVGLGKVAQPVRVALVGGTASPGLFETVAMIGREESIRRLDEAVARIDEAA